MNMPSFESLFTSREKLVKTILNLCKRVKDIEEAQEENSEDTEEK